MRHSTTEGRRTKPTGLLAGVSLIALAAPLMVATPATAFDFDFGEVTGSFDTTLTSGLTFRASETDNATVGIANGGTRLSVNADDGNQNYDTGLVAAPFRASHELLLEYRDFGFLGSVDYFYDPINADESNTDFRDLPDASRDRVGSDFEIGDAFVFGGVDAGSVPIDFRVGRQVLNWGESIFIQNGINTINPISVNDFRIPGSELRDALEPIGIIDVDVGITNELSVEAFYQFEWQDTEPDASGTFFSTNDFASPGGSFLLLGFGSAPDIAFDSTVGGVGTVVPRDPDRDAEDGGQFGAAIRYFAEGLNETEFGLYYIHYHSRLPVVSARTGNLAALAGADPNNPNYAASAAYFLDYPEDIDLFGASFNTQVGTTSVQGEVSYRIDQPLQGDDVELLVAALSPALQAGGAPAALLLQNQFLADLGAVAGQNQVIDGFRRFDVLQAQIGATHVFDPIEALGVDQWLLIGEVGVTHVIDAPDSSEFLLDGPNTPASGTANSQTLLGAPVQNGGYADSTSWGYRAAARFDMLNAIGPINLFPTIAFSHDVGGTTPLPLGNFIEDRAAVSIGVNATYLERWSAGIQYTNFFAIGDDEFNLLRDRDFVSFNIKYAF